MSSYAKRVTALASMSFSARVMLATMRWTCPLGSVKVKSVDAYARTTIFQFGLEFMIVWKNQAPLLLVCQVTKSFVLYTCQIYIVLGVSGNAGVEEVLP